MPQSYTGKVSSAGMPESGLSWARAGKIPGITSRPRTIAAIVPAVPVRTRGAAKTDLTRARRPAKDMGRKVVGQGTGVPCEAFSGGEPGGPAGLPRATMEATARVVVLGSPASAKEVNCRHAHRPHQYRRRNPRRQNPQHQRT